MDMITYEDTVTVIDGIRHVLEFTTSASRFFGYDRHGLREEGLQQDVCEKREEMGDEETSKGGGLL